MNIFGIIYLNLFDARTNRMTDFLENCLLYATFQSTGGTYPFNV